MLAGRDAELARLSALLEAGRRGESGVLVVHGEAGLGKSALLDAAAGEAEAEGMSLLRARGIESEAHLPFAGLAELVRPVIGLRGEIPAAQGRALGGALALEEAPAAPFAVAAGLLSLLAAAAEREPVLVAVDDVQWLDEASRGAVLFSARRLEAEGVVVLLGLRDGEGVEDEELGLPALALEGLSPPAARTLLEPHRLALPVSERLVAAARGVPLALLEVPPLLSPAQRAGQAPLPEPLPLGPGLARAFSRRIELLGPGPRRALLVAACADDLRADLVRAALAATGGAEEDLEVLEREGLLALSGRALEFRHPLVRAAALQDAPPAARRAAHAALAAVLPPGGEQAWHRAGAAAGPNAEVAAALAAAAADARNRGAPAAAAEAFARAAELDPDAEEQARLLLEAAATSLVAGRTADALAHARRGATLTADPGLASDLRATIGRVEALAGDLVKGRTALVREAERVEASDPGRAAVILLEGAALDMTSGRLRRMIDGAERAGTLARGPLPPLAALTEVLVAEARIALGDAERGDAALAAAEPALLAFAPGSAPTELVAMAAHSSLWVERFERAEAILERLVAELREASALSELIYPLAARSHLGFRLGRWPGALADAAEAVRLAEETGRQLVLPHALGALAEIEAALGRLEAARQHGARAVALAGAQGAAATALYGHGALTLLALARGEPEEAVEHGEAAGRASALTDNDEAGIVRWLPDLAEALWRLGRTAEAEEIRLELERQAVRPGHTWTGAVAARMAGLLGPDEELDEHFGRALALHDASPQPFETARTRLLHGERLRRARRRADARRPLSGALAAFDRLGAEPWAERARAELRATGGPTGGAAPAIATDSLTPQELQIALQVARGQTNREVAAAIFLSPKTVEHHLAQVYRKLGIRRRTELAGALGGEGLSLAAA